MAKQVDRLTNQQTGRQTDRPKQTVRHNVLNTVRDKPNKQRTRMYGKQAVYQHQVIKEKEVNAMSLSMD